MAGSNDRNRIASVGRTNRADRFDIADAPRDLTVRARLAERDPQQLIPHAPLKLGTTEIYRKVEDAPLAGEVLSELTRRFDEYRMLRLAYRIALLPIRPLAPKDSGQTASRRDEHEFADRRRYAFADKGAPERCVRE